MAYLIERFGAVYATAEVLPTAGGDQPQGSADTRSGLVGLSGGGAYDAWRGDLAGAEAERISVSGVWPAASAPAMEAKLAALKALRGQRSRLWRNNGADQQWRYARLMRVEDPASRGTPTTDDITLDFELVPSPWYGTAHDDTPTLNTSPKTLTVNNGGNVPVANPILTLTAGSVAITQVKVAVSGVSEIQWGGTLTTGQQLVIDCGARSVKKAGADAYSGFSLTANHKVDDWLRLEPGNNSVVVTLTGGSTDSTLRIQFNDGWA